MKYTMYTVIDRDKYDTVEHARDAMISTTEYESRDAAIRERNRLAITLGKQFCLGIGAFDERGQLFDITDECKVIG